MLADGNLPLRLVTLCVTVLIGCDAERPGDATDRAEADPMLGAGDALRWPGGDAWRVEPQPLLEIGVVAGREEFLLHDVSSATMQADGDIVIADAGARRVLMYNASGGFERTIGSGGSAPGEFLSPDQVVLGPSDSLLVWDAQAWRLTRFDAEGGFVSVDALLQDFMRETSDPPLYPSTAIPLADGGFVVRLGEKPTDMPSTDRFRFAAEVVRLPPGLESVETLGTYQGDEQVTVDSPWGPVPVEPPLARTTLVAAQPNAARVCMGDQDGPVIECVEPDGSVDVVEWPHAPRAFSADDPEIERWRDRMIGSYGKKLSPAETRALLDRVPVPRVRPAYSDFVLDVSGALWVHVGPDDDGSDGEDFLVFDRDGVLLGPVLLPAGRVLEIGHDYVIGLAEDELGVQFVRVYGLRRTPPAGPDENPR